MIQPTETHNLDQRLDTKGRVVIVTGAASGIGAALCRRLTEDGALVVGCDLEAFHSQAAAHSALALSCDVRREDDVRRVVDLTMQRFGRIDGFVANAGILRVGSVETGSMTDFVDVFDVNVYGVLHCIRAVSPVFRQQNHGRFVATTARAPQICKIGKASYSASKAAMIPLVATYARETEGSGILANCFVPGPTQTAMHPGGDGWPADRCYPTVRMLLTLPDGGPSGRIFFNEVEVNIFEPMSYALRLQLDETLEGGRGVSDAPVVEVTDQS